MITTTAKNLNKFNVNCQTVVVSLNTQIVFKLEITISQCIRHRLTLSLDAHHGIDMNARKCACIR